MSDGEEVVGLRMLIRFGHRYRLIGFNRILRYFYTVQRGKEENHLRLLLNKQHTYIEDIKKSNNFYKTKDLIDRYDEEAPSGISVRDHLIFFYKSITYSIDDDTW